MMRMAMVALILISTSAITGCSKENDSEACRQTETGSTVPNVVTADIQAGIEQYIADQAEAGGGYFVLPYNDREMRLKLVRVHTEYLANLGPGRHFACVDLVTVDGDIYDVDFFMSGDAGDMAITETTVHKHNGQPYYSWEQGEDLVWRRVAMENSDASDLGVVYGHDEFEFVYRTTLPQLDDNARMWLPVPSTDSFQNVQLVSLKTPGKHQYLSDPENGNQVLFLEFSPQDSGNSIEVRYNVQRREKACYTEDVDARQKYLTPVDEQFREEAQEVVAGKSSDLIKARALYDHVIDKMRYIKFGDGWGQGDAVHACDSGTGNCTDFHSYFIALARAADIPARFAIGAAIPSERNEGRINGYHCWAEFYADGKWWPVDISEGDKYSSLSTYYFGHHPANRVELSRGRDLEVVPGPTAGSINFLAYPVLEVGGKPVKAPVEFSFTRVEAAENNAG